MKKSSNNQEKHKNSINSCNVETTTILVEMLPEPPSFPSSAWHFQSKTGHTCITEPSLLRGAMQPKAASHSEGGIFPTVLEAAWIFYPELLPPSPLFLLLAFHLRVETWPFRSIRVPLQEGLAGVDPSWILLSLGCTVEKWKIRFTGL